VWAETVAAQQRREEVVSELPVEVAALIAEREEARRMKQWDRADALRDQIAEMGYNVTDTPEGPQWEVA
jgi:cysteinyl-tRNA synthetase